MELKAVIGGVRLTFPRTTGIRCRDTPSPVPRGFSAGLKWDDGRPQIQVKI